MAEAPRKLRDRALLLHGAWRNVELGLFVVQGGQRSEEDVAGSEPEAKIPRGLG